MSRTDLRKHHEHVCISIRNSGTISATVSPVCDESRCRLLAHEAFLSALAIGWTPSFLRSSCGPAKNVYQTRTAKKRSRKTRSPRPKHPAGCKCYSEIHGAKCMGKGSWESKDVSISMTPCSGPKACLDAGCGRSLTHHALPSNGESCHTVVLAQSCAFVAESEGAVCASA